MNIKVLYNTNEVGGYRFFARMYGTPSDRKIQDSVCNFTDADSTFLDVSMIAIGQFIGQQTIEHDDMFQEEELRDVNIHEYLLLGQCVRFRNFKYNKKRDCKVLI